MTRPGSLGFDDLPRELALRPDHGTPGGGHLRPDQAATHQHAAKSAHRYRRRLVQPRLRHVSFWAIETCRRRIQTPTLRLQWFL